MSRLSENFATFMCISNCKTGFIWVQSFCLDKISFDVVSPYTDVASHTHDSHFHIGRVQHDSKYGFRCIIMLSYYISRAFIIGSLFGGFYLIDIHR